MPNGPELAERRISGSRELQEEERYPIARYVINEGIKMLREAPEFKEALLNRYFDGSVESKRELAEGEVTFQKGGFVKCRRGKEVFGESVRFLLIKTPPIRSTESGEIEEAVSAKMHLGNRGEMTWPGTTVVYTHAFTPDLADSSNLLLLNMPETQPRASACFDKFRTGKNTL